MQERKAVHGSETKNEVTVEWKTVNDIREVHLNIGEAHYAMYLVNGMFYGDVISVPEDRQREGIATRIIRKAAEIARQEGVRHMIHHAQSIEGLELIVNELEMDDRRYFNNENKLITYDEAVRIL